MTQTNFDLVMGRVGGKVAIAAACAGIGLAALAMTARGDANDNMAGAGDASTPATAPSTAPSTQPTVTLINIHMQQAMPQDVFDAISKQSGVRFNTNGNLWDMDSMQTALDVDLTNRPFWPAVMEVCRQWDLTVQNNNYGPGGGPVRLQLMQRSQMGQEGANPYPEYEADGFVVQAVSLQRTQIVDYSNPDNKQNNCSLRLQVYVDPALHVQNMNGVPHLQEAADDQGHSLIQTGGPTYGGYNGSGQRMIIFDCQIPLAYPDNPGKTIAKLRGYFTARAAEGIQTVSVDHPLTAGETDQTVGDATILFHSLEKAPNGYALKLSMSRDDDENPGNNDYFQLLNGARLLDGHGRDFSSMGGGGGGGQNGVTDYNFTYSNQGMNGNTLGDPVKWTLDVPTKIHTVRIPFELHDLPLPGQ